MKIVLSLLIATTFLIAQDTEPEPTMSPIVAYWKNIEPGGEGNLPVFLFDPGLRHL